MDTESDDSPVEELPSYEDAADILEPYRGARTAYYDDLGEAGVKALYVLARGSPTAAAEFLGFASNSVSTVSRRFKEFGLVVRKRDYTEIQAGSWRRFDRDEALDDTRAAYLTATSGAERALEYHWTVKAGTEYASLICVADLHYGHQAMDYLRWLELRDWIGENPDVRWLFHGDLLDIATVHSPGISMLEQALPFDKALELASADIAPIAAQCIGLMTGNHDRRIARALQVNYDPVKQIAKALAIDHLGYESFVKYKLTAGKKAQVYVGYHHHGVGSGQTWGSFFNSLERLLNSNQADFGVMGHRHQKAAVQKTKRYVALNNEIQIVDVPMVGAGSFLKHQGESYAVEKGYAPSVLGAATLHLYLDRHSVHARA